MIFNKGVQSKRILQNVSCFDKEKPSLQIKEDDAGWQAAYSNWLDGKSPTNHPGWKSGAFLYFEPTTEDPPPPKSKFNLLLSSLSAFMLIWIYFVLSINAKEIKNGSGYNFECHGRNG